MVRSLKFRKWSDYTIYVAKTKSHMQKAGFLMINLRFIMIIPPVYEVYRGYIVFAFSVCLCVCKLFFRQRFLRNYLT